MPCGALWRTVVLSHFWWELPWRWTSPLLAWRGSASLHYEERKGKAKKNAAKISSVVEKKKYWTAYRPQRGGTWQHNPSRQKRPYPSLRPWGASAPSRWWTAECPRTCCVNVRIVCTQHVREVAQHGAEELERKATWAERFHLQLSCKDNCFQNDAFQTKHEGKAASTRAGRN